MVGRDGGSGGGSGYGAATRGLGVTDQGSNGGLANVASYLGSGGGGAGGIGGDNGAGGAGRSVSITGAPVFYAVGGSALNTFCPGSLMHSACTLRRAGSPVRTASVLTAGHGGYANYGATGGTDGVVIVRYPTPPTAPGTPTAVAGSVTPRTSQTLRKVTVRATLNALGRTRAARPGGARFTFTGVVTQRGRPGSTTARGVTTVLAKTIVLSRSVHFGTDSAIVGSADRRYLRSVRAKLAGAKVITCVGHADSRGSATGALILGARRAKAACAVLAKGRKVIVDTVSKGEKAPTGKNDTDAGRARNRRVDITIHN